MNRWAMEIPFLLFGLICAGVSPAADFDGDGKSGIVTYSGRRGLWEIKGVTRFYFGGANDHPVPGDYNGAGVSEAAIFRPSNGLWAVRSVTRFYFGRTGDYPVRGDFNGDGTGEAGIYRPDNGLWAIRGLTRAYFGAAGGGETIAGNFSGDAPVTGDFSGDGLTDWGIFRESTGLWAAKGITRFYFGAAGDRPVPADYDGDGTDDPAIFRESSGLWAVRGISRCYFGSAGDLPQPADYDGTGSAMIAIFRSPSGLWAIRGTSRLYFGSSGAFPAAADIYLNFYRDFSWMDWADAFAAGQEKFSREYPFTGWKGIDWNALSAAYRPRIAAAAGFRSQTDYYLALREYVYSIPDGHVSIGSYNLAGSKTDLAVRKARIGGGYGLGLIGLDNGITAAHLILRGGPADRSGIKFGAEILEWNGLPIKTARDDIFPIWSFRPSATGEMRRLQQYRGLVRAPVGTAASVVYRNRGDSSSSTAVLIAEDDGFLSWSLTENFGLEALVAYEVMPSGYGYLQIGWEPEFESDPGAFFRQSVAAAIQTFNEQTVSGVILDLRHNLGGDDSLAAWLSGCFYSQTDFYEYISMFDKISGDFIDVETLLIAPREPNYAGPVVALVSGGCISSGEGPAMAVQRLPRGRVISFYGSNGSFGMVSGPIIKMPGGFQLTYPFGRSLDRNRRIQLDADGNGRGGVVPDIRVPLDNDILDAGYFEDTYYWYTNLPEVELGYVIDIFPQLLKELSRKSFPLDGERKR